MGLKSNASRFSAAARWPIYDVLGLYPIEPVKYQRYS
jgi:hypothetical protein